MTRILPTQHVGPAAPYFEGCNAGELRLQQCRSCSRYQFYPRAFCTACESADLTWVAAEGRGRIASFTIVRRGLSPDYEAPYCVALVDLAEGPRMMSLIVGAEESSLRVGSAVDVAPESPRSSTVA